MPNLDARLSTVLMFTNCFIELIKRVKGGIKEVRSLSNIKNNFFKKFLFSED